MGTDTGRVDLSVFFTELSEGIEVRLSRRFRIEDWSEVLLGTLFRSRARENEEFERLTAGTLERLVHGIERAARK